MKLIVNKNKDIILLKDGITELELNISNNITNNT